ncbi:MAG: hypothetical protein ACK50A_11105 [Sphingobacteriaceae bacterium]
MGKPINKHTKDLSELLDHIKNPVDDLDAFEQDALEGFAMLENEQEAIEMKERLDKKLNDELFIKKKQPVYIYWSAAAGVALLIGLILLFKTTNTIEKQDIALNESKPQEQNQLEFKPAPGSVDALEEETKKEVVTEGKKLEDARKGTSRNDQSPATSKAQEDEAIMTIADSESKDLPNSPEEAMGAATPKKAAEKDADDKNSKPGDMTLANNSKQESGAASNVKSVPVVTTKNDDSRDEKSSSSKERLVEKSKKKSATGEAAPAAAGSPSRAEDMAAPSQNNFKPAVLNITVNELNEKIAKFMSDKNYNRSFVCTLTINNANEVETVVFENKNLFKRSQEKEIVAFFKKLKCFKNSEYALYSTYKINYTAQ